MMLTIIHLDKSSVLHFNSIFSECLDVARHNVGLVSSQSFVEIPSRRQTEPLLPGIVWWRKVLIKFLPKRTKKLNA